MIHKTVQRKITYLCTHINKRINHFDIKISPSKAIDLKPENIIKCSQHHQHQDHKPLFSFVVVFTQVSLCNIIPFINRHKPFGCYVLWFRLLLAAVCLCSVVYYDERNEGNRRRGIYCTLPIDKESDMLKPVNTIP